MVSEMPESHGAERVFKSEHLRIVRVPEDEEQPNSLRIP
jgi:hypothetical protein